MPFIKKNLLLIIFLIGLIIRVALMFTTSSFDINNHISWAQDAVTRGLSGFYETQSREIYAWPYPNYPPLAIFIFCLVYLIKQPVFNLLWWLNLKIPFFPSKIFSFLGTREYTTGFYKISAIFFDFVLAYICYLMAKKLFPKDKEKPVLAATLILLNPMFFYLSGLWGQIETIVLTFFLISVYLLVFSKKPILSAAFYTLALLVKPIVAIFLPIYAVYFLKKYHWKKLVASLIVANLIFWVSFLPFYRNGSIFTYPYLTYLNKIVLAQSLSNVSNSAFNFWSISPRLWRVKDTVVFIFGLSYQSIGLAITLIIFGFITWRFIKIKDQKNNFFPAIFIGGYAALMFLTKMHERYFIYLLPLLLMADLAKKKFVKWYLMVSFIYFLNLYYSWSVPYADWVGFLKNDATVFVLSAVNFILFIYFLIDYFHPELKND